MTNQHIELILIQINVISRDSATTC